MEPEFGVLAAPDVADLDAAFALVELAESHGLDFISTYDWPHDPEHVDALSLIAALLGRSERIRAMPNVLNLQARPPAMLARQAASLDRLYPGRFELGLGSGGTPFIEPVAAMGGSSWSGPGEGIDALGEAIALIRLFWTGGEDVSFAGEHYSLAHTRPGPRPAHEIGIWLGAYKSRMLALTGALADGWLVSNVYAPPEAVPALARQIDDGASAAGRDPASVRRVYNVLGAITNEPASGPLIGPPEHWIEQLTEFAVDLGFTAFIFWSAQHRALDLRQAERFAAEVVPGVREACARATADGDGVPARS